MPVDMYRDLELDEIQSVKEKCVKLREKMEVLKKKMETSSFSKDLQLLELETKVKAQENEIAHLKVKVKESEILKVKLKEKNHIIKKFTSCNKMFENIMTSKRSGSNKKGPVYTGETSIKNFKPKLVT